MSLVAGESLLETCSIDDCLELIAFIGRVFDLNLLYVSFELEDSKWDSTQGIAAQERSKGTSLASCYQFLQGPILSTRGCICHGRYYSILLALVFSSNQCRFSVFLFSLHRFKKALRCSTIPLFPLYYRHPAQWQYSGIGVERSHSRKMVCSLVCPGEIEGFCEVRCGMELVLLSFDSGENARYKSSYALTHAIRTHN